VAALIVVVALTFGLPHTHYAQQQSYNTPIVLKSTTTIGRGPGTHAIECNYSDTDLPLGFSLDIIPHGGTLSLTFNGDLVASWSEDSVSVGEILNTYVTFQSNAPRLGTYSAKYSYHLQPGYRIDFNSAFHDSITFKHWSAPGDSLQSYLIYGERFGKFPLKDAVPEVLITLADTIATDSKNVFLMADSVMRGTQSVLSPLSFEVSPYPCIRLSVDASVKTTFDFELGMDTLCVRHAPPSDTLCWKQNTGYKCYVDHGVTYSFPVPIPCETVQDFIVPLCPVRAAGWAHVTLNTELTVNQLKMWYTCPPPGDTPDTLTMTPSACVKDTTWVEQELYFSTDKDDAIYAIPVPLADVNVTLADSLGTTLGEFDEVNVGDRYTIGWSPSIDDLLVSCCSDSGGSAELNIIHFDVENPHPDSVCSGEIAIGLSDATPHEHEWRVPELPCYSDSTNIRVIIEFYCTANDRILHRAWTDTFTYRE
jgi:hypothetical protein